MRKDRADFNGVFAVVWASVLWGTTGTAASYISDVSPLAIGAFAMGGGGLLLACYAWRYLLEDACLFLVNWPLLLIGSVAVGVYPLAFYTSMKFSGVAIGTLVSLASAPFFSVLLERVISHKAILTQWIVSFAIGVLGTIFLTLGKQSSLAQNAHMQLAGVGLGLLAGLSYALYSWSARHMIEKGIHSRSAMAGMFGFAALVLLPSLYFTGQNLFMDFKHIAIISYMAVVPMFVGYLCFGYALQQIEASKATLITLLEPAVATLLAITIVGEHFSFIGSFGIGLIILCLILQVFQFEMLYRLIGKRVLRDHKL
ncbi:DMT family transporter [Celerinatantimonas diazotrophica]|uniref:DME family drug/metabolite transporter n=1 Tax=Celerinatantimonas diazotrophica TaxID=412034 RepID=A0A4R1JLW0_9GAMM|nr:DMT family transporter [Celerinatantimonas diazotrophica]TCK52058.1 DME family drug/metabolite transporter [Celerinatantimonas diazotrophica]CAG9296239.1 hypothetical protein CEDIAZO_01387 [Celerinatantimonas diazotrophica]